MIILQVKEAEQLFYLSDDDLVSIMNKMTQEMNKGLGKDTNPSAKVKMIPSFVESLPDGTGKLYFYSLSKSNNCENVFFFMQNWVTF